MHDNDALEWCCIICASNHHTGFGVDKKNPDAAVNLAPLFFILGFDLVPWIRLQLYHCSTVPKQD